MYFLNIIIYFVLIKTIIYVINDKVDVSPNLQSRKNKNVSKHYWNVVASLVRYAYIKKIVSS